MLKFELNEVESERLKEFQEDVKKLHGEYGHYSYTFTPTGIGNVVDVYSKVGKVKRDITDYDSW